MAVIRDSRTEAQRVLERLFDHNGHADVWSDDKHHRTLQLAPKGLPVVSIDERTALVRAPAGTWQGSGAGNVRVWLDGRERDLDVLP